MYCGMLHTRGILITDKQITSHKDIYVTQNTSLTVKLQRKFRGNDHLLPCKWKKNIYYGNYFNKWFNKQLVFSLFSNKTTRNHNL